MVKKVAILGAGVGGLVTAHELINSDKEVEVHIYERNAVTGGMVRSENNDKGLPGEYCWHALGNGYDNLFRILKEIPLIEDSSKTVFDNLTLMPQFLYLRESGEVTVFNSSLKASDKRKTFFELIKYIPWMDRIKMLWRLLMTKFYSRETLERKYSDVTWKDFCKGLSEEAKKFVLYPIGIYLGMDVDKTSAFAILDMISSAKGFFTREGETFRVFTKPFEEAWLSHWVEYLKDKGVIFHMSTDVEGVSFSQDDSSHIKTVVTNKGWLDVDYVVFSLPVEEVAKITNGNQKLLESSTFSKMNLLENSSRQIQLSVSYYLSETVQFINDLNTTLYLVDSPWVLMILPKGHFFENPEYTRDDGTVIKDIWEVGVGHSNKKGYNGKTFLECTPEEAIEEIWNQCKESNALDSKHCKTKSGVPVKDVKVVDTNFWYSFSKPDDENMTTWEPKFSNNIGTYRLRPSVKTDIPNAFFATAYTQHEDHIFHMEGGSLAGINASKAILSNLSL